MPIILLAAACAKEPDTVGPETHKVPLNITIETKAGGSGEDGDGLDVNSVRVAVFKKLGGAASSDLVVLNEFYPFGFDVNDTNRADKDTVTVRPVLELDLNCDNYYVYVVLNEEGYTLKGGAVLSSSLGNLGNRDEMDDLLATPAVYPGAGVKEAPFCLMSASKVVSFGTDKDRPVDVKFNAADNKAVSRNMAQITVESIKSNNSTADDSVLSELPKIFVLDVALVNVPKDMTWSSTLGNTAGGTVDDLPIGKADADGYYARTWDGSVTKQVEVNVDSEQKTRAALYRTDESSTTGWAFYNEEEDPVITKYLYKKSAEDPRTDSSYTQKTPPKYNGVEIGPYQKTTGGKWYYRYIDKGNLIECAAKDAKNTPAEAINQLLTKWRAQQYPTENAAITAYGNYLTALTNYDNGTTQKTYNTESFNAAMAGKCQIDATTLRTSLEGIFDVETYLSVDKYTTVSIKNPQSKTYPTICSEDFWTVKLGDSYYVPENISTDFDPNSTTCIKVTLALANPSITVPSSIDVTKLPAAGAADATNATFTYWYDNYWQKDAAGNYDHETLNIFPAGNSKMHLTEFKNDGTFKSVKNDNNNYSLAHLFGGLDAQGRFGGGNALTVDAENETVEYKTLSDSDNDGTKALGFYTYIDGFYRTGTGLTAITSVNQNQEGATFTWGIPAITSTTGVKTFYIPVNQNINNTGYSIVRNTRYTVNLTVTKNTYDATKASGSGDDFGFGISAEVTTERLTENED